MKTQLITISVILLFGLNSCGVITKTRYGNGFKLNIESNLFSKGHDKKTSKSKKPLKLKDDACKTEAKVSSYKIESNDDIRIEDVITEPEIIQKSYAVTSKKPFVKSKNLEASNEKSHASSPEENSLNAESKPIEPVTLTSACLFYGSIILLLLIRNSILSFTFIPTVLFFFIIVGGILSFFGLRRINKEKGSYGGKGLAISIITLFSILVLYFYYPFIIKLLF